MVDYTYTLVLADGDHAEEQIEYLAEALDSACLMSPSTLEHRQDGLAFSFVSCAKGSQILACIEKAGYDLDDFESLSREPVTTPAPFQPEACLPGTPL